MAEPEPTAAAPKWPLGVAAGLAVLGIAAAAAMALWPASRPDEESTSEMVPEESAATRGISNPDATFDRLDREIVGAKEDAPRIQAALGMVDFLLNAEGWRPENERQRMAREYLLALAAMNLPEKTRAAVAGSLFRLAVALRDGESLAEGVELLRGEPAMEEMPFDALCAEADALLELGKFPEAYERIDQLGGRPESADGPWDYLLRMARGVRLALENENAMDALLAHRRMEKSESIRKALFSELAERSADIAGCTLTQMEAEGSWNQAYVAANRNDPDAEIAFLQKTIEKGLTKFRVLANVRMNEVFRDQGRDLDQAMLLGRMVARPELRDYAVSELKKRLDKPADGRVAEELLVAVTHYVDVAASQVPPDPRLFYLAGRAAAWQQQHSVAEEYFQKAMAIAADSHLLGEIMMVRAEMAEARGDRESMLRYMIEAISLFPRHPKEADIRYTLLDQVALQPHSEVDLVGGIIGAVSRLPQDPRGVGGLLLVAHRLEEDGLYEMAEAYYRRAILLMTLQQVRDSKQMTAEALLGQARTMLAQDKESDADTLLRVMNTNMRWADYWNQSGPLWAAIAFKKGQYREGVRRWRHTCGPPGGELLPRLFELLVPDLGEWAALIDVAAPRRPARAPVGLVQSAAHAAFDQLLQNENLEEAERLLNIMESDSEWRDYLPLAEFRTRCLEKIAVPEKPFEQTAEWLKRHPVRSSDSEPPDLNAWISRAEAIAARVSALRM